MNILVFSPAFLPMVGGLENMAFMLSKEWSYAGMKVTVVTQAFKDNFDDEAQSFRILRNPSRKTYWKEYLNADIIFFLNVSLKGLWPTLLKPKPTFISHQITYYDFKGNINFLEQVKRQISRRYINISCSNFVKDTLPNQQGIVIPNAYDSTVFKNTIPYDSRQRDLIFVGRLVSDKGVDTLIKAIKFIQEDTSKEINLTIVGKGPELKSLQILVEKFNLKNQIKFVGSITGLALSNEINQHKIMVVPSKWKEPFGLVALEGLACGCKMIVSANGGLKEAVGNMAHLFINGSEISLAKSIISCFQSSQFNIEDIEAHLKKHTQKHISYQYLSLFKEYTN